MAWTTLTTVPASFAAQPGAGVSPSSGLLYLPSSTTDVLYEYNPGANSWATKAAIPDGRSNFGFAVGTNGLVYAISGSSGSNVVTMYVYNPGTSTWTLKGTSGSFIPNSRTYIRCVTGADGKIYALGGLNSSGVVQTSVYAYDPTADSWATKAVLPAARFLPAGACGADGTIYAIGGYSGNFSGIQTTVYAYDPTGNSWATKATFPAAIARSSAACGADGKIYVLGGVDASNVATTTVYVYDPAGDSWSTGTALPASLKDVGAVAGTDGTLYSLAGALANGAAVNTTYSLATGATPAAVIPDVIMAPMRGR